MAALSYGCRRFDMAGLFDLIRQAVGQAQGYDAMGWTDYRTSIDLMVRELTNDEDFAGMFQDWLALSQLPADGAIGRYFGQSVSASYCKRDTRHSFSTMHYPEEFVRP